jgi:hypothetical protein
MVRDPEDHYKWTEYTFFAMEYDVMCSQFFGSLWLRGDNASSSKYSLEYFPVFPAT